MINSATGHHIVDTSGDYDLCPKANRYYIEGSNLAVFFWLQANRERSGIYVYDISNLIDGVAFRQVTLKHPLLPLRRLLLEGDHLTIEWEPCHWEYYHITTSKRVGDRLYLGTNAERYFKSPQYAETVDTMIFPPAETDAEWQDRMHRTLAYCAHQFEKAVGAITPQLYTHSDNYASANLTSEMVDRVANTGMHTRLQIGYLWHQVLSAVDPLAYPRPARIAVETDIFRVFKNMKTPEHIKAFFHHHDREEWKKLRHQSSDHRHNHRRIHIWDTDYTAGKLLLDVNAKNSTNGVLDDLEARAEFHTCATKDYKLAASSPNWELITERVY